MIIYIYTYIYKLHYLQRNCNLSEASTTKRHRRQSCKMATITPEIKMLTLLCYFIVYTAVLSSLIVVSVQYSKPITEGIFAYFLCQLNGENSNCEKLLMEFRQYVRPGLASATFLMTGLINWIYLIFPIHYNDIEYIFVRATSRIHHLYRASLDSTVRSKNETSTT